MSMVNVQEGMFAYGITPNAKRAGDIGWISRINYEKKIGISYRDGRTATWNVSNIVVAHEEEAYEDGVATCELYMQYVQRHQRSSYRDRGSYRARYVNAESVQRPVRVEEYPAAEAVAVDASPVRNRANGSRDIEFGNAIQELSASIRELLHITRETSGRLRGLEERVSRVEAEASVNTDAMSGATMQYVGGEIEEIDED